MPQRTASGLDLTPSWVFTGVGFRCHNLPATDNSLFSS